MAVECGAAWLDCALHEIVLVPERYVTACRQLADSVAMRWANAAIWKLNRTVWQCTWARRRRLVVCADIFERKRGQTLRSGVEIGRVFAKHYRVNLPTSLPFTNWQ